MRWAQVVGGLVVNVILWDGVEPFSVAGELLLLDEGSVVGPGWSRVDGVFVPPVEEG